MSAAPYPYRATSIRLKLPESAVYEVYQALYETEKAMIETLKDPACRAPDGTLNVSGRALRARSRILERARQHLTAAIEEAGWDPPGR